MAASATFALKAGVWFRRGRRCIVSPDSLGTACPPSGRNSTYRPVQILEASSFLIRPLVIALVLGAVGAVLSWLEEVTPQVSDWVPSVLFPSRQDPGVAQ